MSPIVHIREDKRIDLRTEPGETRPELESESQAGPVKAGQYQFQLLADSITLADFWRKSVVD
jgi:hypothetical protein